jgi:hypothetical protein
VCPDERRCSVLIDWTKRELKARDHEEYAQLFLFTSASPVAVAPEKFFFGKLWHETQSADTVSLIEPPLHREREKGVIFQQV